MIKACKMLILKITLQILSMLSTWVIARLDYSYGKGTSEFKKGRLGLFTILSIIFLLNIVVTIRDDQEKRREIEESRSENAELKRQVENIKDELIGGDSFCYLMHEKYMYRVLRSNGTRNRCKPAISVAGLLLFAEKGRLWLHGHMFVRQSPLQKPKLMQQFLQRYGSNLLSCMLLCLNPVFCSNTP